MFVESSVLIAAFYEEDPRNESSLRVLQSYSQENLYSSGHSFAEAYSIATRLPGNLRAAPQHVYFFLKSVRGRLDLVSLEPDEYMDLVARCAARGDSGGSIYDAIIGTCALKCGAEALFTWNVKDFNRLFPEKPGWCKTPDEF